MSEPIWLDVDIVIDIHNEQLSLFGGPSGIRDLGLLESALARPLNRFAYGDADLAHLAAAYAYGLARNHPFIDGKKRTAFAATLVFLGLNGIRFLVLPAHATACVLALAAGEIEESAYANWLKENWPSDNA